MTNASIVMFHLLTHLFRYSKQEAHYHIITKIYARKYIKRNISKSHFKLQFNLLTLLIFLKKIVKNNIIEI